MHFIGRYEDWRTPNRLFALAAAYCFYGNPNEVATNNKRWARRLCAKKDCRCEPGYRCHLQGQLVVAVDGACRGNGTIEATEMGVGVYFGRYNAYNISEVFRNLRPTNQRAELLAAIRALEIVVEAVETGDPDFDFGELNELIIKTDSAYTVNAMTAWIYDWQTNGFTNKRGHPVKNQQFFRRLNELRDRLEDQGIAVMFWNVTRDFNPEADQLAKTANDDGFIAPF